MPEIKWIKLTTDMFDDEKIKLIEKLPDADMLLIIWIKLICQAGKINDRGAIYLTRNLSYNDEELATVFNRPVNVVRLALGTFQKLNMIEIDESGIILLINWEKHQNIEALNKIRNDNRRRVKNFRERQRLLTLGNVTVTLRNDTEEEGRGGERGGEGPFPTLPFKKEDKSKREEDISLEKLLRDKRYDEIMIESNGNLGLSSLSTIIKCLKGELKCLPANKQIYLEQLRKLNISLEDIGIEEENHA